MKKRIGPGGGILTGEWKEYERDKLLPQCPYCGELFKPKPDLTERKRKCKNCQRIFKYWACYYTVTKFEVEDMRELEEEYEGGHD